MLMSSSFSLLFRFARDIEDDDVVLIVARASRLETLYLKLKMEVRTSAATLEHAPSWLYIFLGSYGIWVYFKWEDLVLVGPTYQC
jgi:hypothetical protein